MSRFFHSAYSSDEDVSSDSELSYFSEPEIQTAVPQPLKKAPTIVELPADLADFPAVLAVIDTVLRSKPKELSQTTIKGLASLQSSLLLPRPAELSTQGTKVVSLYSLIKY